jgi:hypothetical protein
VGRLCRFPGRNYVENCGLRFRVATVTRYGQEIAVIRRDVPGKSRKLHRAISGIFRHEKSRFCFCFSAASVRGADPAASAVSASAETADVSGDQKIAPRPRSAFSRQFATVCGTSRYHAPPQKGFKKLKERNLLSFLRISALSRVATAEILYNLAI